MNAYIKDNFGTIVLLILFFLLGASFGVFSIASDDGVYISVSYDNGNELITVGSSDASVKALDLSSLSSEETAVLASKIKSVSNNHLLGIELRELAKRSVGPFKPIPVQLNIHFIDEQFVSGPVAKACRNTPLWGNAMVVYELVSPIPQAVTTQGLMNVHATREQLANCNNSMADDGNYNLWLNKSHVERWLGSGFSDDSIVVNANIVVSNIAI